MCTHRFRAYLLSEPWRDPAEMIVISYSTTVPSGYDRVYSIRINELEYAIRDGNFNSLPITRVYDSSNNEPRYIVHARIGMNYQLYIRNYSRNTNYEIVATVDGFGCAERQARFAE